MKKTEKIEVRLSHEEKAELTKIAEGEGRSVSELIRHLVERYIALNTARLPKKTPWLALGATAVAAFLAGHLMTYAIGKSKSHPPVYNFYTQVDKDSTGIGFNDISVPIIARDGYENTFLIPREDGDVRVSLKVEAKKDALRVLNIQLCEMQVDVCAPIAAPVLTFDHHKGARLRLSSDKGYEIQLGVEAVDHEN